MTQEEKQLLLKDLCARLPYKPKIQWDCADYDLLALENCEPILARIIDNRPYSYAISKPLEEIKPYLRSMESITEEEKKELIKNFWGSHAAKDTFEELSWYLSKHLDVNGLIPKGLAIEVTEENNPYKEGG